MGSSENKFVLFIIGVGAAGYYAAIRVFEDVLKMDVFE